MAGPEHFPHPTHGFVLTHFIVSDDVERSRRFSTDVLGGETVREGARAEFLTPPVPRETEIRCYIRDPDGYLIEVAQTTTTP